MDADRIVTRLRELGETVIGEFVIDYPSSTDLDDSTASATAVP